MQIGQTYSAEAKNATITDTEKRDIKHNFKETYLPDTEQVHGIKLPKITQRTTSGNIREAPYKEIPADIFRFELILNSRKFVVLCDTLLQIEKDEDLADFSETQLKTALELCSSYRVTCMCAYVAAHKEVRKWKTYHSMWMAEKRTVARKQLRSEKVLERDQKIRKDIGQITAQELEDWIITKYTNDYKSNLDTIGDWEDNEKVFLELRDTLKDRGMHLQTLLKRVDDHTDPNKISDGTSY